MNQVSRVAFAGRLLRARGIAAPKAAKDSRANLAFSLTAPARWKPMPAASSSMRRACPIACKHTGVLVDRARLDAVLGFYRDILGCAARRWARTSSPSK